MAVCRRRNIAGHGICHEAARGGVYPVRPSIGSARRIPGRAFGMEVLALAGPVVGIGGGGGLCRALFGYLYQRHVLGLLVLDRQLCDGIRFRLGIAIGLAKFHS